MKKNIYKVVLILSIIVPSISFAALDGIKGLIVSFQSILNLTIPVVFGLALVFFFWGTAQFILHADVEKARDDGKKKMLWGVVALFVIVSIYGILGFIGDAVGIKPGGGSGTTGGVCTGGFYTDTGLPCGD